MRIVTVTTIRNESDIIEAFVRYHLQIVDRMFIINHRSCDSSSDILSKLKKENLPIELGEENSLDLQQGAILTRLARKAVEEYGADWVIPLDADEFLSSAQNGIVREWINDFPQDRIIKIPWRTYVPLPTDNCHEKNVLKRIKSHRSKECPQYYKIMIPRPISLKKGGMIDAGNHRYVKKRYFKKKLKEYRSVETDKIFLSHFPVRSSSQVVAKSLVGWLACLSKPNKQPNENFHLKKLFDHVINGGPISEEELTAMALDYATLPDKEKLSANDIIINPVLPEAGNIELRYTAVNKINPLKMVAEMAEEFAEALASAKRKISKN